MQLYNTVRHIVKAARTHGEDAGIDHAFGDLEGVLYTLLDEANAETIRKLAVELKDLAPEYNTPHGAVDKLRSLAETRG